MLVVAKIFLTGKDLLVRRFVRTLSVPVRGVSRFASLRARTYSGQGTLFT